MKHSERYLALATVALFCFGCVYLALDRPVHDFANYYFGGKFLGENRFVTDIYFPNWFNRQIAMDGNAPLFAGFAPNTPFLALLFYPLSFLPLAVAKFAFNLLSAALFISSLKRLSDFLKLESVYLFLIPVFFLVPIRNELLFGQVYLLLFFLLGESWLASQKNQPVKAAAFLSMAIMLKVFPVLLLLFFAFRKDFKTVVFTIAACLAIVLITLPFCTVDLWRFYLTDVLKKASAGEIASAFVPNYQSPFMFLKQLLVYDRVENPGGLFSNPSIFNGVILAFKVKVLAIGWHVSRKATSQPFVFAYWVFACLLISPYGSTYTFVLLLFVYFATLKSDLANWAKITSLALIFLISNLPLSLFLERAFPVSYLRFFALAGLFIMLVATVRKLIDWKMVSALSLIAFAFGLSFADRNAGAGEHFLSKNSPLLISDYKIDDQKLTCYYWNENGENTAVAPIAYSSLEPADLTRNQIYYRGKKLVYDNSHKRKPVVIDGKTLLYLTDSGRGIGFYTLRKIDIDEL